MTSASKIRFGILGCANIAIRSLMPAIAAHPACRLAAVASRSRDKAAPLAAQYGCRALGYDEIIADPSIDAIYVPLPTGLHAEWVMKCLKSGKHVLCEKSLACTENEVKALVDEAKKSNLFLMESFQFRFHSQNLHVKKLLSEGVLGKIRCVRASFGFPPFKDAATNIRYKRELGGGALLDAGAYTIKAATFMLGSGQSAVGSGSGQSADGGWGAVAVGSGSRQWASCNPVKKEAEEFRVKAATLRYVPEHEVDVGGAIFMEHDSGVAVQTAFGFDNFYQCNYEIWGTKGKLTLKRAFTAPPGFEPECILETAAGVEVKKLSADDHFARLLDYVANCIETNTFENEYRESLIQSRLIQKVKDLAHV